MVANERILWVLSKILIAFGRSTANMNHQKLNLRSKCETLLSISTELSYVFFDFSKHSSYSSCKIEIKWKFFHIKSWKVLFCPILLPDFGLILPKLQSRLSQLVDVLEGRATRKNARTRELLNFSQVNLTPLFAGKDMSLGGSKWECLRLGSICW